MVLQQITHPIPNKLLKIHLLSLKCRRSTPYPLSTLKILVICGGEEEKATLIIIQDYLYRLLGDVR
jgi:hypothetical protein